MKTVKFRPHDPYPLKFRRRLGTQTGRFYWHVRRGYTKFIDRCGGRLHYLADHAPHKVQLKYKRAFRRFTKLHPKF